MKTRNSIRTEINELYKNKVITWLTDSIKFEKNPEPTRIYLGAPTRDEDVVANKDEFIRFCKEWRKDIAAGKVDFIEKTYPDIGTIQVPIHLVFDRVDEIATWAGHLVEFHSAEARLRTLQSYIPDLIDAGIKYIHFLTALDDVDFLRFVCVCKWLCENKKSGALIREIPVRGVDTAWFEVHRFLILNFLNDYLDLNPMRKDVFQLGLVPPTQTTRVILLDNVLRGKVGGLRDLGISAGDLGKLDIKPKKVYFFDDLATALSLPDIPGVVAIVLSSDIAEICKISWIAHAQCTYVSGIELRAFAMINNIRMYLPNTQSLMLNKECLDANRDLCSYDDIEFNEFSSNMALTVKESMLCNMLISGVYGRKARLPQERIPLNQIFELLGIEYEDKTPKPIEPKETQSQQPAVLAENKTTEAKPAEADVSEIEKAIITNENTSIEVVDSSAALETPKTE